MCESDAPFNGNVDLALPVRLLPGLGGCFFEGFLSFLKRCDFVVGKMTTLFGWKFGSTRSVGQEATMPSNGTHPSLSNGRLLPNLLSRY